MKQICASIAIVSFLSISAAAQVRRDDYPALAMRMNHQGTVRYRAEYDAQGALATCTVTRSSGYAELDAQTCTVLKRDSHALPQPPGVRDGSMKWQLPH